MPLASARQVLVCWGGGPSIDSTVLYSCHFVGTWVRWMVSLFGGAEQVVREKIIEKMHDGLLSFLRWHDRIGTLTRSTPRTLHVQVHIHD